MHSRTHQNWIDRLRMCCRAYLHARANCKLNCAQRRTCHIVVNCLRAAHRPALAPNLDAVVFPMKRISAVRRRRGAPIDISGGRELLHIGAVGHACIWHRYTGPIKLNQFVLMKEPSGTKPAYVRVTPLALPIGPLDIR